MKNCGEKRRNEQQNVISCLYFKNRYSIWNFKIKMYDGLWKTVAGIESGTDEDT